MKATPLIACAGAVALCASVAIAQNAAPAFRVNEIRCGGDGSTGIFFDGLYQDPNGTNFPPSPGNTAELPQLQYDSYVAMGGSPVTPDTTAFAPDVIDSGFNADSGYFDEDGVLQGRITREIGAVSRINPLSGRESVFFARLTEPVDTFISGSITFTTLEFGTFEAPIEFFDASDEPGFEETSRGFREFRVVSQKTQSRKALEVFTTESPNRGNSNIEFFDVYDLYIEQVPTPGTASLLGIAGIAALRRRR